MGLLRLSAFDTELAAAAAAAAAEDTAVVEAIPHARFGSCDSAGLIRWFRLTGIPHPVVVL